MKNSLLEDIAEGKFDDWEDDGNPDTQTHEYSEAYMKGFWDADDLWGIDDVNPYEKDSENWKEYRKGFMSKRWY